MAEAEHAEKVKGLQWNFTTNLYRQLALFQDLRNTGKAFAALLVLIHIIEGAPEAIQDQFEKRLEVIHKGISLLREKIAEKALDEFNRRALIVTIQNKFAEFELQRLYPEVSVFLDKRGYMEQRERVVQTGRSHTARRTTAK